jgi:acylphosphatase
MPNEPLSAEHLQGVLETASASWSAAATPISRLSPDFARLRLGYTPGPGEPSLAEREQAARERPALAAAEAGAPSRFDWRDTKGASFVSAVRDQGSCGSCVAFAVCATVESMVRIARGQPDLDVDLSEAQLFYCIARSQGRTCAGLSGGWWPASALDGCRNPGVTDEACYPYFPGDQDCTNRCSSWESRLTKVTAWHALFDTAAMKSWLATRGPLTACFSVYTDFYSYSGGVYHHVMGGFEGGHCVCVVGYDDSQGAWICKNSWGTWWGDDGYFLIRYGDCGIDSTMWAVDGVTGGPQLDGRLFAFARGSDNALYSIHQTVANGGWSSWEALGGDVTSDPAAGSNLDGTLEVFVRGNDDALYHRRQTMPSGGWDDWAGLGGGLVAEPVVAEHDDGRLRVFIRGTDDAVWTIEQTASTPPWTGWQSLGGVASSSPATARNGDGRREIFVRGNDGALYRRAEQSPGGGWDDWSGLGGGLAGRPTVGVNADGRLQVFVQGTDDALWTIHQISDGTWSDWESLGGALTSTAAVAANADGRLEVFVRGTDDSLYHRWQTAPNGGWSDWSGLGGALIGDPVAGVNEDGRVQVFVHGTDQALWTRNQLSPGGGWSNWVSLHGVLTSGVAIGRGGA